MRFALADLKKTILRRRGEPRILPHLLRPGDPARELDELIVLYESWIGRERMDFPADRPAELIGDYRLARCLDMCLGEWYEWQSPPWPGPAGPELAASLAASGITSASHLRLALYDFVNARFGGYLGESEREGALAVFAGELGIPPPILDLLLALDSDPEAVLRRPAPRAPTAAELAARYNQRAVEALLANAAAVEWVLPAAWSGDGGDGLGTVVKRICFLARRMGVQYDLAFAEEGGAGDQTSDQTSSGGPGAREPAEHAALPRVAEGAAPYETASASLDACGRPLVVTLYGPQEVMGAPNQYGERLARLCRALLGYRRQAGGHGALAGGGLRGTARIYLHGRPLLFSLDDRLLHLLRTPDEREASAWPEASDDAHGTARSGADGAPTAPGFDSSLEARLHSEFLALEAMGETHGWHLEREPAPLLAEGLILVPDFALARGARRVYLEIAGYWRPGYRERKARKLAALRGRVDFILAAPAAARAEFGDVERHIELLWYDEQVSVQALLTLLDRAYNDFAERLAALDVPWVRAQVMARGRIPSAEAQKMLRCYTRAELGAAVRHLRHDDDEAVLEWVEGIGLCSLPWLEGIQARAQAEVTLAPAGSMPLGALRAKLAAAQPDLAELGEPAVEALARRAGLGVRRASIFEAEVLATDRAEDSRPDDPAPSARRAQPRQRPRRTPSRGESVATLPLFPLGDTSD